MRKILILTLVVLLAPIVVQGQEKEYPYPLKPGERFRGSAAVDTLFWVLKSSQYDKAISDLKSYKKEVELLEQKSVTLEEMISNKDSTIADYKEGYDRYKVKWEETQVKLEDKEVQVFKLRRWTVYSGLIGIGAGVLLGVVIF